MRGEEEEFQNEKSFAKKIASKRSLLGKETNFDEEKNGSIIYFENISDICKKGKMERQTQAKKI